MTINKKEVQRVALHFFIKTGLTVLRFVRQLGVSLHEFQSHAPSREPFSDSISNLLVFSVRAVAQKSIESVRCRSCTGSDKKCH